MNFAALRTPVSIEQPTTAASDTGQPKPTWSTFASKVWALIEDLQGSESIKAQNLQSKATKKITIRYLANVVPKMRVKEGSKAYNIVHVDNVKHRNEQLVLMCEEVL